MPLTLRKTLTFSLLWLIPFACLELLILLLYATNAQDGEFAAILSAVTLLCLFLPGAYYLVMFFRYRKSCKDHTPVRGVITNWQTGFFRGCGGVILKLGDKEYSTASVFSYDECKEMVGKTVSYALIDEDLFLYAVEGENL